MEERDVQEQENTQKVTSSFDFRIIIVGLLIFLAAMGASYFLMKSLMAPLYPQKETQAESPDSGNLVEIAEFTTNIADVGGNRYVKVEVFLEVKDKKNAAKIEESMPVVKDVILSTLASKSAADLDVRNRESLKGEIKQRLNEKLGANTVSDVYFTNFIMQ